MILNILTITFDELDIEFYRNCKYDFIQVCGWDDSVEISRIVPERPGDVLRRKILEVLVWAEKLGFFFSPTARRGRYWAAPDPSL